MMGAKRYFSRLTTSSRTSKSSQILLRQSFKSRQELHSRILLTLRLFFSNSSTRLQQNLLPHSWHHRLLRRLCKCKCKCSLRNKLASLYLLQRRVVMNNSKTSQILVRMLAMTRSDPQFPLKSLLNKFPAPSMRAMTIPQKSLN